jgi:hypothetical protein
MQAGADPRRVSFPTTILGEHAEKPGTSAAIHTFP